MTVPLLLALPWVLALAGLVLLVRFPRELLSAERAAELLRNLGAPPVSVIVPARNEAHNIGACVASLAAQDYPDFEVLVVDDRSEDGTGEVARAVPLGRSRQLRVIDGRPLPPGWFGKPWACRQGADEAVGELLLFTDADTVHAPDLLARVVAAALDASADALTLAGRQVMGSFWERVVQPQVFLLLAARFPDLREPLPPGRWRDAIANGQYILLTREAYDGVGTHEAVRGEVAEDLALGQALVRGGRRLVVRLAEDGLATRMYRSLREMAEGWSKNMVVGGARSMTPLVRRWLAPAALTVHTLLWVVPPLVLGLAAVGVLGTFWLAWAGAVTAVSVVFWAAVCQRMGAGAAYGLLYPLGSAVTVGIWTRSWVRGSNVEWKGRRYRVEGWASGDGAPRVRLEGGEGGEG